MKEVWGHKRKGAIMKIETTAEIDLRCADCGYILDNVSPEFRHGVWRIEVIPCKDCIKAAIEGDKV